jgi:CHAT domain-containing protein
MSLKPLLHTADEARRIAALFRPHSLELLGPRALESELTRPALQQAGVVHFATHALVDENAPERAGLALTPAADSDGILQVREVYELQLRAALVTLSACQTALGQHATGEGIIGLSRAFFYAGAGAVTASLWNVNDRSASELMARFYRSLRAGQPIDEALAAAKRAFLAGDPRWRHPYYWAPFIVTGEAGVSLPLAPDREWQRLVIVFGLVVLIAVSLIVVSRRGSAAMVRG